MLEPSAYVGREQTFVKHFVLENYLERVAFNIFSFQDQFTYIDGFSGPWKSADQSYEDTSFKIATDKLLVVQKEVKEAKRKSVNLRCLFIEKKLKAFKELEKTASTFSGINIELVNGTFEDNVSRICDFARNSFSLIFIDPTGWQGFAMEKIKPLLNLRGEVLINFMSDHINRFLEDPRPEIAASFDSLFGTDWYPEWKRLNDDGLSREAAAIEVYTTRLKEHGNFKYVTSTRILKPKADRSYFYLIYATEHWKGVQEFRKIEKKAIDIQEQVRDAAKFAARTEKTGQTDLFGTAIVEGNVMSYEQEREQQLIRGLNRFTQELKGLPSGIKYEELLGRVLEIPLVWESDLKKWIAHFLKKGDISIPDLGSNKRVPSRGNTILLLK